MPADDDGAFRATTRADRVLLALAYAPIAPVTLGAGAAWVGLVSGRPVEDAAVAAVVGLAVGLVADARLVPRWVRLGFDAPAGLAVGLYVFHAVTLFVLSMGVPVPQLALGAVAGAVAGRGRLDLARTRRVTTTTLAVLGTLAAFLAVARPSTAYDLRRSLGLPFEVTPAIVLAMVVVGGPLLLGAQWVCTTAGARLAAHRPAPARPVLRRAAQPPVLRQPAVRS